MKKRYAVLLALLLGCSDSTNPTTLDGEWHLSSVDAEALPVVLIPGSSASCGLTVESGTLTLGTDMRYNLVVRYGPLDCAQASYVGSGAYSVSGSQVTLSGSFTLARSPSTLTHTTESKAYVWRK